MFLFYKNVIIFLNIVYNPCNLDCGYVFRYDNEPMLYLNKAQTSFNLSTYANKPVVWSVESYMGNVSSGENKTNVTLCNFDNPKPPILTSPKKVDVIDKKFEFNWTDPNTINESCGVELKYTYNIVIKSDKKTYSNRTTGTSIVMELETGEYTWEVTTNNSIYSSSTTGSTLSFCYSEELV